MRPLTGRQQMALRLAGMGFVNGHTKGSMPSLIGRGLIVAEKKAGRLTGRYLLTDRGRQVLGEIERNGL